MQHVTVLLATMKGLHQELRMLTPNQSAAANRRPAGQSVGAGNLAAIVAAARTFPAAVAELDR